jgi:hypothetical protein
MKPNNVSKTAPHALERALVAILLAALFLQAVLSMRLLNASQDETTHLPSGYTYLKTGQLRLNPQHPPLIKYLCAAPLLFLKPRLNLDDPAWRSEPPNEWKFGYNFLYTNDADKLLFWGRLPVVILSLLLGFYIYKWARALFGVSAGLMALFLYAFCPNVIAHARFVTMDVGLSCFFLICLYYLWRFVRQGGKRNLVVAGVTLGLALTAKFSAVVLVPIFGLLLGMAALWAPGAKPPAKRQKTPPSMKLNQALENALMLGDRDTRIKLSAVAYLLILATAGVVVFTMYGFPGDPFFYLEKIKLVNKDHNPDYQLYLMGHFKPGGWWYYFIVAFLLKTPVPTLILLGLAMAFMKRCHTEHWLDDAFLILPVLIFTAVTSALADNLGIRYLLPIYPLLFIFISRLANFLFHGRIKTALAVLLIAWYLVGAVRIYPYHLAYFNELIGGPNQGYKYLEDSNIDWGEGLKLLKNYMDKHHMDKIKLLYNEVWIGSPDYYKIKWEPVSGQDWHVKPSPGIYAISTHLLIRGQLDAKTSGTHSDWMNRYKPIDRVGYSFYIFKFE